MRGIRRRSCGRLIATVALGGALVVTLGGVGVASAATSPEKAAPPQATTRPSNVYVACGYGSTASGCLTLPQALSDAEAGGASAGTAYIELMPGDYCPLTIPYDYRPITILGVGLAGEPSDYVLSGPEAALSTFTYDSSDCGSTVPTGEIDLMAGYEEYSAVVFENVAFDPGTGGPEDGIDAQGVDLTLRDDLIEHASDDGLYLGGEEGSAVDAYSSAFIDDGTGAVFLGSGSISTSLVAGNATGLYFDGATVTLLDDTIAQNTEGVGLTSASEVQVANTIVGDNTNDDCQGDVSSDWEYGGTSGGNGYNLVGSTCDVDDSTDIALTDTLADPAENGGPTPSITAPSQAQGAGSAGWCLEADQREFVRGATTACDIGSVDSAASGTPDPGASPDPLNFGTVDQGVTMSQSVYLSNSGGDLVGVSGVSVSGPAFSLTYDGCTDDLLSSVVTSGYCIVEVSVKPTSAGAQSGTLDLATTAGTVAVPLSVTGGPVAHVPRVPTGLKAVPGNGVARLSWTAPTNDGGNAVNGYTVRYSSNWGATWLTEQGGSETSLDVYDLTNNVPYLLEVQAQNGVGAGGWSAESQPVIARAGGDPSAILRPATQTVAEGNSATLTTTLTDTHTSKPIASATVLLLTSPATGAPVWTEVGSAKTGSTGKASHVASPTVNTLYEWLYQGTSSHSPIVSGTTTVSVSQVVSVSATKSSVAKGAKTQLYGTVSPSASGHTVELEELVSGKWKVETATATLKKQLLPNGKTEVGYILDFSSTTAATDSLRVLSPATATNAAGDSSTVKVTVT